MTPVPRRPPNPEHASGLSGRLVRAAYRLALLAFPAEFRSRQGRSLLQTLTADRDDSRLAKRVPRLAANLADVARAGMAERLARPRRRGGETWSRRGDLVTPAGAWSSRATFWWDGVVSDTAYALRFLARRPASTAVVVLILAGGIGMTTAVFSIVDAVLLRPLPWKDPHQLVRIQAIDSEGESGSLNWQAYSRLREAGLFADVAAWHEPSPQVLLARDRAEPLRALRISSSFLPLLGVPVAQGRNFSAAEDPTFAGTALITHEAWQQRFGGRPDILGSQIVTTELRPRAASVPRTVVGVLPPGLRALDLFFEFRGLSHPRGFLPREPPELLLPLERRRGTATIVAFGVLARLSPDRPRVVAAQYTSAVVKAEDDDRVGARLEPLIESQTASFASPIVLLFAGAGLLLVVACANVAGLLLSQADSRRQEMAVRRALGAGPATLLRHLLTECLFVAAAAGIAGALLAWWLTPALAALTDRVPGLDAVRVNGRVVGFALLATMATVVLSGVVPAWVLSRVAPADALKQGARTATRPQRRWHQAIMAAQVALSFLLLIGASLLVETMLQLSSKPLPFDAENLATISTRMVEGVSETDAALALPAVEAIVEQLEEIPGVVSAGAASAVPFLGSSSSGGDRMPAAEGGPPVQVWRAPVTRRYFETMRMPVRGRSFAGPSSDAGLVIVSEAFGRRVFGDDAVGRRLQFSPMMVPGLTNRSAPPAAHPPAEVIGVVPDLAGYHPSDPDFPLVYVLREEFPSSLTLHFVVRTQGSPDALLPLLRETIASASPHLLVTDSAPMTAVIARSLASERLRALLSTTLAATALLLVVVGLYAHAARLVSDRRREVGLRLAIGAGPREITALFIRQGLKPMLLGLALGVPLAYVISSAMASFVFGVSPTAPHVFLFAASVLVLVGAAATWQPVTRAARLDPTTTLREE